MDDKPEIKRVLNGRVNFISRFMFFSNIFSIQIHSVSGAAQA